MRHPDYHDTSKRFRRKEDWRDDGPLCASARDTNLPSHLIVDHMTEVALIKLFVKYREKLSGPRLRIQQNPFASRDYDVRGRSVLTDFLDMERYGVEFEKFINAVVAHPSDRRSMEGMQS